MPSEWPCLRGRLLEMSNCAGPGCRARQQEGLVEPLTAQRATHDPRAENGLVGEVIASRCMVVPTSGPRPQRSIRRFSHGFKKPGTSQLHMLRQRSAPTPHARLRGSRIFSLTQRDVRTTDSGAGHTRGHGT